MFKVAVLGYVQSGSDGSSFGDVQRCGLGGGCSFGYVQSGGVGGWVYFGGSDVGGWV